MRRRHLAIVASVAIIGATALGAILLVLAMRAYPGGTAFDPTAPGHSFWFNFLCDLTSDTAVNGIANPSGARLGRAAMMTLALAVGCFWVMLPSSFANGRRFSVSIRTFGLLAVAGILAVPAATGWAHVIVVLAAAACGLTAATLGLVGSVRWSRSRVLASLACASVVMGLCDSILYARSYMDEPRVIHPALPFFQRLALILFLAWMVAVAVRVLAKEAVADDQRR
jgi:hypothetical protein